MDLQAMQATVAKVVGMTWSHSQIIQWQNQAIRSYPRICSKCSFSNAHNHTPQRVGIPNALRSRSERKIQLFNSQYDTPHLFTPFRVWGHSRCEHSNARLRVNSNKFWLMGGQHSTYFCSVTRSFCRIPRSGTKNRVVWTEAVIDDSNSSFKSSNKSRELQLACSASRGKGKSMHDMAVNGSEDNINGSGYAKFSSPNSKDFENCMVIETTEKAQGKEKTIHQSRSKKKGIQPSIVSAPADTIKVAVDSTQEPLSSKSRKKKDKLSEVSSQITLSSSSVAEAADSGVITKKKQDKVAKSLKGKKKSNTKAHSSPNSEEKGAEQGKLLPLGQSSHLTNKTKFPGLKAAHPLYPPSAKSVVVVESVTKAKVIQGYLGEMFEVVPSHGHVRDLAARSGSVRPDDDFSMLWEVPHAAWSHLKSMKVALSGVKNLILATDPDREGEAIAWHIVEMLHQQDALPEDVNVARVSFHEITESSIKAALQSPREIDVDLVNAYLARRALDYLIGFNVSPLLWRKLPACQSAGRVQSAALALICDREKEIDESNAQEYWTVDANFQGGYPNSADNINFSSQLTHFDFNRLSQLSISSNLQVRDIGEKVRVSKFVVIGSSTSKVHKNPPAPFITSTLQQDAANRLNFSASHTMKVAQKLYEGVQFSDGKATGLITYMRTDGMHLSDEAARDIRSYVVEKYGTSFASKTTRKYFKKVKNAQEAHEAIRATDIRRLPSTLVKVLDEDSLKLYTLIWCRTMACQMEPAVIKQVQCDIGNEDQSIMFHSGSSRVDFLGFRAVYEDSETLRIRGDDDDEYGALKHDELFDHLCNLKRGQPLSLLKVELGKHFTKPPPRYTEASLVKKLEELGIGRPSTYAVTIKVLKDRNYIVVKNRTLYPEFRGRMVSAFLSHYFSEVTDYSFTADMETELDNVSAGITEWKGLLNDYWSRFEKYCESASKLQIRDVEKMLEKTYGDFLFASLPDGNRTCPSCKEGTLVFKVSRIGSGYFLGCDQYPKCKYIAKTLYGEDDEEVDNAPKKTVVQEPKLLGLYPGSNEKVLLKNGPYGYYLQLGDDRKGHTPKRASLSQIKDVESVTLEQALNLLKYPITLGKHPDDGHPVILRLGKLGFSIKHRRSIASVPKNLKPEEVSVEKALKLLQGKNVRRSGRPKRSALEKETMEVF